VESAAAEEIDNRWPAALFLDDFHKRLGKLQNAFHTYHRPGDDHSPETLQAPGTKTSLLVLNCEE